MKAADIKEGERYLIDMGRYSGREPMTVLKVEQKTLAGYRRQDRKVWSVRCQRESGGFFVSSLQKVLRPWSDEDQTAKEKSEVEQAARLKIATEAAELLQHYLTGEYALRVMPTKSGMVMISGSISPDAASALAAAIQYEG